MVTNKALHVDWDGSAQYSECTLHQLSPYIGKMKSTMASSLITQFTKEGDTIYDPFCGAGTVGLEAWISGRNFISGDLSPYAYVLARGKVSPPRSLDNAIVRLDKYWVMAEREKTSVDLRNVPKWVRRFFHPETLREAIAIRNVLIEHRQWFLLSCLLGILHHWRPGFLSYPCSHTVPYLKSKLYPRSSYPELYSYREVYPRILAKVQRAFKRVPYLNRQMLRKVKLSDAVSNLSICNMHKISAIITSPPYMNSLSYARDNRLRLWFLGIDNHKELEPAISPRKTEFLNMMHHLLIVWTKLLVKDGLCILVLGAVRQGGRHHDLPTEILDIAKDTRCGLYSTVICKNIIPDIRRARINCRSTREETILVFRKGR